MTRRLAVVVVWAAATAAAQKYSGPKPPKADVPFLLHAETLVETDVVTATEEKTKEGITYAVAGAASAAKTPLAGPIFLFQPDKIAVEKLRMYPFTVKGARRTVYFSGNKPKDSARPVRISISRLEEGLYRIEVGESLANGEYGLSPDESNTVFCFQVY
ncbi:MAG: hypothetical protein ACRD96_16730 [Bryobacteraceae bacterium]